MMSEARGVFRCDQRKLSELDCPQVRPLLVLHSTIRPGTGFCCDLASLPIWFARTKAGRRLADLIARSAIVHDLMRNDVRWPKLLGDYVFFEAMAVDRVPLGWRLIAFAAVLVNSNRT